MIDGPKITLGGRELVVPPANLRAIRAHGEVRDREGVTTKEIIDANFAFVLATLQRNYPDLTEDFLLDNMDSRNQSDIMGAIFKSAGFDKAAEAGEPPAGA